MRIYWDKFSVKSKTNQTYDCNHQMTHPIDRLINWQSITFIFRNQILLITFIWHLKNSNGRCIQWKHETGMDCFCHLLICLITNLALWVSFTLFWGSIYPDFSIHEIRHILISYLMEIDQVGCYLQIEIMQPTKKCL